MNEFSDEDYDRAVGLLWTNSFACKGWSRVKFWSSLLDNAPKQVYLIQKRRYIYFFSGNPEFDLTSSLLPKKTVKAKPCSPSLALFHTLVCPMPILYYYRKINQPSKQNWILPKEKKLLFLTFQSCRQVLTFCFREKLQNLLKVA